MPPPQSGYIYLFAKRRTNFFAPSPRPIPNFSHGSPQVGEYRLPATPLDFVLVVTIQFSLHRSWAALLDNPSLLCYIISIHAPPKGGGIFYPVNLTPDCFSSFSIEIL